MSDIVIFMLGTLITGVTVLAAILVGQDEREQLDEQFVGSARDPRRS